MSQICATDGMMGPSMETESGPDPNVERFGTELELVQCLASPFYLASLAQQGYFEDEAFLNYMAYLKRTWQQPLYARYIVYPQALAMLDLLESKRFRDSLKYEDRVNELSRLQIAHWATHRLPPRPAASVPATSTNGVSE